MNYGDRGSRREINKIARPFTERNNMLPFDKENIDEGEELFSKLRLCIGALADSSKQRNLQSDLKSLKVAWDEVVEEYETKRDIKSEAY